MKTTNPISGFTLIELMIVIAIVGILASMAFSSYTGYTKKADRVNAQSNLYELSQIATRAFTDTRTYVSAMPSGVTAYDDEFYDYSYAATATTFTITAAVKSASRDNYDMQINHRSSEQFRKDGKDEDGVKLLTWNVSTGWSLMPE